MPRHITLTPKGALGQIHVYTGDGKGKSTAALGLAIRAAGHGLKVGIVYFDKGGTRYGERNILTKLHPQIDFWVTGLVRFEPGRPFRFGVIEEDKVEALKGLDIVRELFRRKYDLVILDEINSCIGLNIVPLAAVLQIVERKPKHTELILTGRYCPPELVDRADLVTEMVQRKHYFYKGVPARQGIEF